MRKKKYYSVYLRATDEPLVIHATAERCAELMGITIGSFFCVVSRYKTGRVREGKYEVFVDPDDDIDEE